MTPELIIFDCDGVLVDSEVVSNQVLADNLEQYGLSVTLEQCLDQFVGGTIEGVKTKAIGLGAQLPSDWITEIYEEIFAKLRQGVPVIAGIPEILDTLDGANIAYCVASNGSEEKMAITLGQNGLLARFEKFMFSAHSLGTAKPDPHMFLHAAKTFNVSPDACIVIEDSTSGAKAARRAHMKCFGYAPHNDGGKLQQEGAEVFHNMSDLVEILKL
jgi:HAD superfamily hydrolase (TIGR01509 family)